MTTREVLEGRRAQLRADLEIVQTRCDRAREAARQAARQVEQLRGALALCEELLAGAEAPVDGAGAEA